MPTDRGTSPAIKGAVTNASEAVIVRYTEPSVDAVLCWRKPSQLDSWSIPPADLARSKKAEGRPLALGAPFPADIEDGFGGEGKPAGLAFECLQG